MACFGVLTKSTGLLARDEIGDFACLGRFGANSGKLRVIDARHQCGIYILYGNYGPYYVGFTRKGLGFRLKQHLTDDHEGEWDRFSWFGFNPVLKGVDQSKFQKLGRMAESKAVSPKSIIADVEALIIRAMDLRNIAQMKFTTADEWRQINRDEVKTYLARL